MWWVERGLSVSQEGGVGGAVGMGIRRAFVSAQYHFPKNINVFNLMVLGFNGMLNPYCHTLKASASKSNSAAGF